MKSFLCIVTPVLFFACESEISRQGGIHAVGEIVPTTEYRVGSDDFVTFNGTLNFTLQNTKSSEIVVESVSSRFLAIHNNVSIAGQFSNLTPLQNYRLGPGSAVTLKCDVGGKHSDGQVGKYKVFVAIGGREYPIAFDAEYKTVR